MAADGSSEAAGQHGSHARLRHVTTKGVQKFVAQATNVPRAFIETQFLLQVMTVMS